VRLDELVEAQTKIRALLPCPYCGAVREGGYTTTIAHGTSCPIPHELQRLGADNVS
jgi:hypothetical protein